MTPPPLKGRETETQTKVDTTVSITMCSWEQGSHLPILAISVQWENPNHTTTWMRLLRVPVQKEARFELCQRQQRESEGNSYPSVSHMAGNQHAHFNSPSHWGCSCLAFSVFLFWDSKLIQNQLKTMNTYRLAPNSGKVLAWKENEWKGEKKETVWVCPQQQQQSLSVKRYCTVPGVQREPADL